MAGHYQILLPLLSLFLVRVDLTDLFRLRMEVTILKIYDGDTVLVGQGSYRMRVRLAKIDAPEKDQLFFHSSRNAGKVSSKCLAGLLKEQAVLKIEKEDMYGRILGDLDEVSYRLVKRGCVTLYPYAQFSDKEEKFRYLIALKTAKARHLGLWQYSGFMQPKKWRSFKKRSARRR